MNRVYTVTFQLGTYTGIVTVVADEKAENEQVIAKAKTTVERRSGPFPAGRIYSSWKIESWKDVQ